MVILLFFKWMIMNNMYSDVLFEEISHLGVITLNRPHVLNALNHKMFLMLDQQLTFWEQADHIKAVVIRAAEGRAFCAGGDIRRAYELKMTDDPTLPDFFRDEYRLNHHIFHYTKPYIALLDGITMGGGAGISWHGSHRIGTERLLFAMPETAIGFYPDVGATYHLSRLPNKIGYYLGLTGARIHYGDCLALGIIQQAVSREDLPKIVETLANTATLNHDTVTEILKPFSAATTKTADLLKHQAEIAKAFSQSTVEDVLSYLDSSENAWCQETAKILKTKSPTSLKITFAALQKAVSQSFDHCMNVEYRLTNRFIKGRDFFEGIRAAIIDKDQQPHWQPASLSEVHVQEVEKYFAPLTQELVD